MHTPRRFARARTVLSAGIAGLLILLASASPASALPIFQATANAAGGIDFHEGNVAAGSEVRFFDPYFGIFSLGSAIASPFGLLATGAGRLSTGPGRAILGDAGGSGKATAIFDDFIIRGPAGPVIASFDLILSGRLLAMTEPPPEGEVHQANSAVIVRTVVNGLIVTADGFFQDRVRVSSVNGVVEVQRTGMLAGWPADPGEVGIDRITTPTFTVNANEFFTIEIDLTASAGVNRFGLSDFFPEANSDFGSTLKFPTFGSIFHLPDGYTVESVGARIANNAFLTDDPTVPPPGTGVPQPASLALLALGAAAMAAWSRRARARRPPPAGA